MEKDATDLGMYWYLASKLEEIILMVRYFEEKFIIQVNVKDFDFALNIDQIEAWKESLRQALAK